MMKLAVTAAQAAHVSKFLLISNVYPYGRAQTPLISEAHPRVPCSVKGQHRKEQEDILLAAHNQGGLQTMSLRSPNFFGPYSESNMLNSVRTCVCQRHFSG
jgi:nucleoside-diphosphate-sugar epimerase